MSSNRSRSATPEGQSPPPSPPPPPPPPPPPSSPRDAGAGLGIVAHLDAPAPSGVVSRQQHHAQRQAAQAGAGSTTGGSGGGRGSMSHGRAIWRGSLCLRGQTEEIKVDVKAYALRGGSAARPSFPETLICDSRGLEGAAISSILADRMNNPGFAHLQVLSPAGDEIVDPRITNVAEVIEERGAAFNRVREGYMVFASRDNNNQIGLYVLYDRTA